ncbi:MAG TPA: hypothetical protein VMW36_11155, partial [Patescibacteria group bacterium]|nr:hypothetical protein [Patescibacteria group bacterium]
SSVTVYYNLTSTNFVENNPVEIALQVVIPNDSWLSYDITFVGVAVLPKNAIDYYPANAPNLYPLPSRFVLTLTSNDSIKQVWTGFQWVEFQSLGAITMKIELYLRPTLEAWNMIDWLRYTTKYGPFTSDLSLPSPYIESGRTAEQQTQQQIYENYNLSLTFFVLFFASIDIAIVFYDHSEPKYKPDYE